MLSHTVPPETRREQEEDKQTCFPWSLHKIVYEGALSNFDWLLHSAAGNRADYGGSPQDRLAMGQYTVATASIDREIDPNPCLTGATRAATYQNKSSLTTTMGLWVIAVQLPKCKQVGKCSVQRGLPAFNTPLTKWKKIVVPTTTTIPKPFDSARIGGLSFEALLCFLSPVCSSPKKSRALGSKMARF